MFKLIRFIGVSIFFLYTSQVQAMVFLDFMRVYIFSEVDGVVLLEGKPVKGAKVIRTADYQEKIHSKTVTTDAQGRFHFDDIYTYSLRLSETAILQKIMVHYENKEYMAWEMMKRNDNRYGELNDPETPEKPIKFLKLNCELTKDQTEKRIFQFELGPHLLRGLCRLD